MPLPVPIRPLPRLRPLAHIVRWLVVAGLIALVAGSASAFFLFALDAVTRWREADRRIVWLLPMAGFTVGWVYWRLGRSVEAGNNLLIDEIHDPQKTVPLRMVPLVLGGTLISHLLGASVGREGTAVQMGGALADQFTRLPRFFGVRPEDRRILLMAGIAAGFSSVFGAPLAGAIFALEVLALGRLRSDALFPCVIAAVLADRVGAAWGVHHTHYRVGDIAPTTVYTVVAVAVAGIAFGLAGRVFAGATHRLGAFMRTWIAYPPLRPLVGGVVVATALWTLGGWRYIGLGIPTIVDALQQPLPWYDWLGKLLFTVASLGSGFKGGEVTPLFYIGATLGNALAPLLQLPFSMLAAIGFVAVFAGAANTPIACIVMAVELFGPGIGPLAAVGCVVSYLCSGHAGIYRAQRIGGGKFADDAETPAPTVPPSER